MTKFNLVLAALEAQAARSAWSRGVKEYARELLAQTEERAEHENREPGSATELKQWMLNGAQNWQQYSEGACSLIYNEDIAKRLCTPSELKKTRNGQKSPNVTEDWITVQARALQQAANLITRIWSCVDR